MAVTLAIFAAVQVAMPLWIRPNLFPASHTTAAITSGTTLNLFRTDSPHTFTFTLATDGSKRRPGAWIQSSGAVSAAGHPVSTVVPSACSVAAWLATSPDPPSRTTLTSHGIRIAVTYQPTSRYWPCSGRKPASYLRLSLALGGSTASGSSAASLKKGPPTRNGLAAWDKPSLPTCQ